MNALTLLFKYINYKLFSKSKKGHGIHSPFVFEIVNIVFHDTNNYPEYELVEKIKDRLLNEERKIKTTIYGASRNAGKKKFKKLNSIAKKSSVKEKYGRLLYRLVRYSDSENILELGTSFGISTSYMAHANRYAKIHTIEGCYNTLDIAKTNFKVQGFSHIETYNHNFDNILAKVLNTMQKVDFAFIDGNHQKESTLKYFEKIKKYIHNDTILIFDDIRWSEKMEEAWEIIKSDKQVTLSIDIFYMGIVFFRKESTKQNFTINF